MSWFRDLGNPAQSWSDRLTFLVDTSGEVSGANVRAEIDLGDYQDFDWLWDLIEAHATPGNDLRITHANGTQVVPQAQITTALDTATRTGVIRFDFITSAANVLHVFHLYLGNSAAGAAWGFVTHTNAVDAHLMQDGDQGYPLFAAGAQAARSSETRAVASKHPADKMFVGFEIQDLQKRCTLSAGLTLYEEVEHLKIQVLDDDVNQPSMYSAADLRVGACPRSPDRPRVRATISGGVDATDYGVELTITTTLGRQLVRRAGLSVRQTTEG